MQKYSVLRVIILYILITAVWAGYRYFFVMPEWVDEVIAKPVIDLLPILSVVVLVEKNSLESLGLTRHNYWFNALMGLGLGALLLFESVMTRYFKNGSVSVLSLAPASLLLNLGISFATAFTEETVFRGYFFRRFMWIWESEVAANILSTVFFTVAHLPLAIFALHYSGGQIFTYSLEIYVLGTIFAYVFARVESIVPTTIAHTIWNFANVFIK